MMLNYDYNKFLEILKATEGLHNSLNEILKYDFIYHSNKIEGSTIYYRRTSNAYRKEYRNSKFILHI